MYASHISNAYLTQNLALLVLLFQPALVIIDFGHFQYNSVMLGREVRMKFYAYVVLTYLQRLHLVSD